MPIFKKENKERKKGPGGMTPTGNNFWGSVATTFLILIILSSLYSFIIEQKGKETIIPISELAADISAGKVESVTVKGDDLSIIYKEKSEIKNSKKESNVDLAETLKNYNVSPEKLAAVKVDIKNPSGFSFWFLTLAPFIVPVLFIIFFIWFLTRQVKGAGMQAFTFGQSKARVIDPNDKTQRVTFKDVAGVKEAKEELLEIVDFLKSPKKFLDIGARIPKGVLLMGPPGSGKTLLARAVAGEAGVPFFSISGSEFVEMFVGVGASVTGDTPVLVKDDEGIRLVPISNIVDRYYKENEAGIIKCVSGLQTLGFKPLASGFRGEKMSGDGKGKVFFGGSEWSPVEAVLRHKSETIYEIHYRGGMIKTTGDHSIFVRKGNMISVKRVSELTAGDILVNLPFKVRSIFVPGTGTTHKVRSHQFLEEATPQFLNIYEEEYQAVVSAYNFALAHQEVLSRKEIGSAVGVSGATIGNWQNGIHQPRFLASRTVEKEIPSRIEVSTDLMKLFGYYAAEGRTTPYYTQWVFGLHEKELHADCVGLIERLFHVTPDCKEIEETNSFRITVHSAPLTSFFEKHVGNGSHNKKIPQLLWALPKKHFLAFLDGYAKGDGYVTKDGKMSMTSVSQQLIRELAWLSAMHGIKAGVRETHSPAGRVIREGGKPLPETRAWNLIIGKTANPFVEGVKSANQIKKPIVEKVVKKKHIGYVYDFCGCRHEAFFGGEKPLLLHNSRVRDLFQLAKKAAPAIVFVDEIDAVGRVRGTGVGGGNDEREQTLNQILVEMDGFEPTEKLIIMAATNRPDVLDPALLRPGRFDRRVVLDLPDREGREEILKIHAVAKPLAEDVNLKLIAERTPGFSGADLYSLMNEGAILAARESRKKVSQFDLIRSIEKVMLGPERKSHLLTSKEKEITAYHEAGHALVSSILPYADPVHKISIISRGRAAGYTLKLPLEDRRMQSRNEFLDDIASTLGGFVTEKMIFGDVTTGPSSDLQVISALARDMVTRFGMSEKLGPVALEGDGGRIFFGRGPSEREYSEKVAAEIDAEVSKIISNAMKRAEDIIKKHRKLLDAIAKRLIEVETIERDDFEKILITNGITPKKKLDIEHQS